MRGNVFERMYAAVTSLVPAVERPVEGASFYAPPKVAGDCASYCTVSNVHEQGCDIEIAVDSVLDGRIVPAPWMAVRVNLVGRTAELLAIEDGAGYEQICTKERTPSARRTQLNAAAVNNLASMLMLGGEFQALERSVAACAELQG